MKVIFDTNVLISAFLTTTGPSQHILSIALQRYDVTLSEYILTEFANKLRQKLKMPEAVVYKAVDFLRRKAIIVSVQETSKHSFSDIKDRLILDLIEVSSANYFITGDKALLELKKMGLTVFLSPREALKVLENG